MTIQAQQVARDSSSGKSLLGHGYRFPINPGKPGLLAGTMGELRNTHFHAGLDIRTNNMVGMPVLTTKKGYVSRAIVGSYGYGKALFVTHPDGNTSVYGHLERFKGDLGKHIRNQQYQKKSFEVDLFFRPGQFPVQDGDTIAFSGNTGGSSGPHLHFEIRDSANEALNPLLFGFPEITDLYPPVAYKIALKTLDIHSRINDHFGRFEFYLLRNGNQFILPKPILAFGRIGIELLAYDKMDRSGFKCGINEIDLYAGEKKIFSQVIDKINFDETRGILNLMDFKSMKNKGERYNKLYTDDGTRLDYHINQDRGELSVAQQDVPVRIVLRDSYRNESEVRLILQHSPPTAQGSFAEILKQPIEEEVIENTMVVTVRACQQANDNQLKVYTRRDSQTWKPDYSNPGKSVYLIDLRKVLPDSVVSCQGSLQFHFEDAIPSGTDYKYYGEAADILFDREALYDTLYLSTFRTEKDSIETFTIGSRLIPLHKPVKVSLKPQRSYRDDGKTGVYLLGNGINFIPSRWVNGRLQFQTQELGDFSILKDIVPPYARVLSLNSSGVRFRIKDDMSGIGSFEATIDGQWLLMNYDYKTGILQSERLDSSIPLKGNLQLKVIDNSGNETIINQIIR